MIKFEDARSEISKRKGTEAPKQIKSVMDSYNRYILNWDNPIVSEHHKNINNLVWYTDLSGYLKSKKDLFEDAKKELEIEGIKLTAETFKRIDKDVNLSRFDYPSAFHLICKKVRESIEDVIIV